MNNKVIIKKVMCYAAIAVIFFIALCFGINYNMKNQYRCVNISFDNLIGNALSINDFSIDNNRVKSLSDDPWIEYENNIKALKTINVNVNYLSDNYTESELFVIHTDGSMERYVEKLKLGSNEFNLHLKNKDISSIRFDLLMGANQVIGIDNITINDPIYLNKALKSDLIYVTTTVMYGVVNILPLVLGGVLTYLLIKYKNKEIRTKLIKCVIYIIITIFVVFIGYYIIEINVITQEKIVTFNEFVNYGNNVKDFEISNNRVMATSDDPWIVFKDDDGNTVRTVNVNISNVSLDKTDAELFVFFENGLYDIKKFTIKKGENTLTIPQYINRIEYFRFDLTDKRGVEIDINNITLNDKELTPLLIKNEILNLCVKSITCILLLAATILCLLIGKVQHFNNHSSKYTENVCRGSLLITALLTAAACCLVFYIGIGAVVIMPLVGYIVGIASEERVYTNKKDVIKKYCVCALIATIMYTVMPAVSIHDMLVNVNSGNAVKFLIVVLCLYAIVNIVSAGYKKDDKCESKIWKKGDIVWIVEPLAVFIMSIVIIIMPIIFFYGYNLHAALFYVFHSESFYVNVILFGLIYYFFKHIGGGIVGRVLGVIVYIFFLIGNYVKIKYHDSVFLPMDILQVNDFISIVKVYIPGILLVGSVVFIAVLIVFVVYKKRSVIAAHKPNLLISIILLGIIIFMSDKIEKNKFFDIGINIENEWQGAKSCALNDGIIAYSYIKFREVFEIFPKPDGNYSEEYMSQMEKEFDNLYNSEVSDIKPDIIFIMEESLFDVCKVPDVKFSKKVDENINKYKNSYVISPKYGGGTGSVEFEGLTGMSNFFFLDNVVPYVTYWNNSNKTIPGLAEEFNDNGYETIAIHPNSGNVYNRTNVYKCMGFDKFLEKDDMDFSENNITDDGYFKDDVLADYIKENLNSTDEPKFMFAVTIENHTLYESKYKETEVKVSSDKLSDSERNELEQYSQGALNGDRFVKKMIDIVNNAKRPTLLYIWGDHLPALSAFNTLGFLNDKYNKYSTPLIVYSNYKNISIGKEYITPNQLAPQILRDSGIKYSSYFDFIYSLREKYPVIQKEFISDKDEDMINKYREVQYDILFGKQYLKTKYRHE